MQWQRTRDELEGPRGDLLAGGRHADDHALAPALVAALQRRAHHAHVADALERVVHAAHAVLVSHLNNHVLETSKVIFDKPVLTQTQALQRLSVAQRLIGGGAGADSTCQTLLLMLEQVVSMNGWAGLTEV